MAVYFRKSLLPTPCALANRWSFVSIFITEKSPLFEKCLEEAAEQQKAITKTRRKEKHERRGE
jgi:hypothetical protein